MKKTYININSNDRLKTDIINTIKYNKENIIIEILDYNKIKIIDSKHNLDNHNRNLFRNIKGDYVIIN